MVVWIVTDESKACYDAGGIFDSAFSSYELALAYVHKLRHSGGMFTIDSYTLDSEQVVKLAKDGNYSCLQMLLIPI